MPDENKTVRSSKKPFIVLVIGLLAVIVSAAILTPKLWHRLRYPASADGQMLAVRDVNGDNEGRISKKPDPRNSRTYITVNDEGGFGVHLIETDDSIAVEKYYKGDVFVKILYDPTDIRKYVIEYDDGSEWYLFLVLFGVGAVMTIVGAVALKCSKAKGAANNQSSDERNGSVVPLRAKKAFLAFDALITVALLASSACLWSYYMNVRDNYTATAKAYPDGLAVIDDSGSFKPARNGQDKGGVKKTYLRLEISFQEDSDESEYIYTDDLDYRLKKSVTILYDPDDPQDWCIDEKRDSYRLCAVILAVLGAASCVITVLLARNVLNRAKAQSSPNSKPKRKRTK